MSEVEPTPVPEGLAVMAPGPELAAVLAGLDVADVAGVDTVEVLTAQHRQMCHERARFLLAVLETGLRAANSGGGVVRMGAPGEFACEEARAALMMSRRRAGDMFRLSHGAFVRLPSVGAAMLAGDLDESRVLAFVQWTRELNDAQAEFVCEELLEEAAGMTTGALIDAIKRLAIMLDPDWAERRYRAAVNERRVVAYRNDDGSANVSGINLPIDRAKAGCDRIERLARACKRAGDGRGIDQIRADLYLGMIDGALASMSDDDIVAYVLMHAMGDDTADLDAPNEEVGTWANARRDDTHPNDGSMDGDGDDDGGEGGGDHDGSAGGCGPDGGAPVCPNAGGAAVRRGVPAELRVELTTLLGRDQHPGELPGLGYIPAAVARRLVRRMAGGQWRFVICDDEGRPVCSGITTRRPCGMNAIRRAGDGGVVEIQVRARDLSWIDAFAAEEGAFPVWGAVIADIATRVGAGDVDTDAAAEQVRRRAPGAGLRRWLEARGRHCAHPACSVPATACDQDHRVDHARGGPTEASNLCPLCRHDHRLKTEGGWQINAITADGVAWVSGLGRRYWYRPPPVMIGNPVWVWEAVDAVPPVPRQSANLAAAAVLGFDDVPPF